MADILLVFREGYDGWALGVKDDDPIGGGGMLSPLFNDDIPESVLILKNAFILDASATGQKYTKPGVGKCVLRMSAR